jgi:allophanate hydrolase subunit 1
VKVAPAGDRAVLIELGDVSASELHSAAAAVRALPPVLACIVGHSSLYVVCEGIPDRQAITTAITAGERQPATGNRQHEISVHFAGADLPEFLLRVSMTRDDFLTRVRDVRLVVRYLGFRGGFAYLDGWPREWAMPRRTTSRPVPRGSFAIAGDVAGFYPIDTPGGWNLLGMTGEELENRFAPGDEIIVVPATNHVILSAAKDLGRPDPSSSPRLRMTWEAPFATLVTVVDWSRVERGLPPGGPFDDGAAAAANLAVGNAADAPLLECAMVGPRVRATEDVSMAWCDARGEVRLFELKAGEEITIGRIGRGLRGYLAVGKPSPGLRPPSPASGRGRWGVIHAVRGPHDIGLEAVDCVVTPQLDRVGVRVRPVEPIDYSAPADLRSCGMQYGTVQLHPDGSLVIMGPDHPVTGGYLQPMTVLSSERWKVAQLAPGERVRLIAQPP